MQAEAVGDAHPTKMDDLPNEQNNPHLIEPSNVDPETEQTRADAGTRLFVLFFFLVVSGLGVALVAAVGWQFWRFFMAG